VEKLFGGSKSCVGDDASLLDSDIVVVVEIVAWSLQENFRTTNLLFFQASTFCNIAATMN